MPFHYGIEADVDHLELTNQNYTNENAYAMFELLYQQQEEGLYQRRRNFTGWKVRHSYHKCCLYFSPFRASSFYISRLEHAQLRFLLLIAVAAAAAVPAFA